MYYLSPERASPFIVAVDDIMFQKPVEVGSLLFLSSQVGVCDETGKYNLLLFGHKREAFVF